MKDYVSTGRATRAASAAVREPRPAQGPVEPPRRRSRPARTTAEGWAAKSEQAIGYTPNWSTNQAGGAYLLTGSAEVAAQTLLLPRLRKALNYDLWGYQFGSARRSGRFSLRRRDRQPAG